MPELLRMLASAGKSGTLIVESAGLGSRLELINGQCGNAESADLRGPLASADELHQRAVEVCFAMTRYPGGAFRFAAADAATEAKSTSSDGTPSWTIPIEPVLGELELLVAEWAEICRVIPSTDLRPTIAIQLAVDEIVIQAREWKLLAQFDGMTSVDELCSANASLVDTCRAISDLVRRGAATLVAAPALGTGFDDEGGEAASGDISYFGPRVVPVAPYGPGVEDVAAVSMRSASAPSQVAATEVVPSSEPVAAQSVETTVVSPVADPDSAETSDPRDRGAILRMFSGLREA